MQEKEKRFETAYARQVQSLRQRSEKGEIDGIEAIQVGAIRPRAGAGLACACTCVCAALEEDLT